MTREQIFDELLRKYKDNRYLALKGAGVSEKEAKWSSEKSAELMKRRYEEARK